MDDLGEPYESGTGPARTTIRPGNRNSQFDAEIRGVIVHIHIPSGRFVV